jgi:hypothetical protein
MEKLKLPIIADFPAQDRWLSMDEYIKFVNFISAHFRKTKNVKKNEIDMRVNVPFSIK